MNGTTAWPRGAGEASSPSVVVARSSPDQHADADPFATLRDWVAELRSVKDRRAELLELELAAELGEGPQQARAHNREANHLRASLLASGWLEPLAQARALIRGASPIHSDASWLRTPVPDHAMAWLRGVDIGAGVYALIPLGSLERIRRFGVRLQRLALDHDAAEPLRFNNYTGEALISALASLRQLERLELHCDIPREYLTQMPQLGLRQLALAAGNYDLDCIHRFADTLESLQLSAASAPATLDGLALPRLEALQLGRNWSPDWALERRTLRSLGFCLDASAELPPLDWPTLETLALDLHGAEASAALRRLLAHVAGLARLRLEFDAQPHEVIELDLAGMPSLLELELECREPGPRSLALTLPASLARLRLSGFDHVVVHGECEQLETTSHTLAQLPRQLCERVARLTIVHRGPPDRSTLERVGALEWLSIAAHPVELIQFRRDLDALPRLRTLVIRGFSLEQVTALTEHRPELAIHGVDPGWRDHDRWPLPPT